MEIAEKNDKEFLIMKIWRVREGIKIYAKSEKLEKFFLALHNELPNKEYFAEDSNYSGLKGYCSDRYESLFYECGVEFNSWGSNYLVIDSYPQLSFLRAVGLKNGITVLLKRVYSLKTIEFFVERSKNALQKLYTQYIKPIEVEIIIKGDNNGVH